MNVQLSRDQLTELRIITMSRQEKLLRLARVIRSAGHGVAMFSGIEYYSKSELGVLQLPNSPFDLASRDPILKDAGLKDGTVGEAQRFFELTTHELHQFACNCGGYVTNETMAHRVEALAAR